MSKGMYWAFPIVFLSILIYRLLAPEHWPKFDLIEIGLVCIAFTPFLASIFSELSVGGLFSAKLRDLQQKVTEVSTDQAALEDRVLLESNPIGKELRSEENKEDILRTGLANEKDFEKLSRQYLETRREFSPGDHRTKIMENLMQLMVTEADNLGDSWPNLNSWMTSDDAGRQLCAIAYGLRFPNSIEIQNLLDVIKKTEQPFIQYWALRLVRIIVRDRGHVVLTENDWKFLRDFRSQLSKSTDRARLIGSILALAGLPLT